MPRYVLWPDDVPSANDGDIHFISASHLIQLYLVDPNKCVRGDREGFRAESGDINLTPRFHGDYKEHLAHLLGDQQGGGE